ncbi:metallophosphoesterase family protein [Facklamia miroungae]|uniref:Calcineurin-like phosphoesterase n=1 Tax=Facklamia miroungae TaxID=120956 RepID=A0A1G7Q9R0_9LACT|nr:metallophosphoesterase family protein [Facklamia miroungae]NKZ28872.1 metallophosphoesterase family protein [Facklamia miroungae]SDF95262.1 Calcineurin-like phosphoesterase [Facklamia miroungae]
MQLKYRPDGTFRIIQFTDTHIGNMPFHEEDERTFKLIEDALAYFDVDLIIHTGDIIWSEGVKDADIVFEKTMEYFDKAKIPMAITFGNHDTEEIITRSDLRRIFDQKVEVKAEKTHSMIVNDREAYCLEIFHSDKDQVAHAIYLIDSGAAAPLDIGTYDWVLPQQVAWFSETSANYRRGDRHKRHLVFQHIPLPEYWQAATKIIDGVNHETNDAISAPYINTGLFANMVIDGETWGMFVGHDHDNDFEGVYHDIHLVYGNVSGYQTYGAEERGVRIIELKEDDQSIKTYRVKANVFSR